MGNAHKDRIMPVKTKHVKLGVESYLPSCQSVSIQGSKSELPNQNPESQSSIFSQEQAGKGKVSELSRSYLCNPSIFGDSSQNQDLRKIRKLSQKDERTLRIVKKIIGENRIDFYTEQMLVHILQHPEENVENMVLRPNLREYYNQKQLNKVRQQRFLQKLIDKNVFDKQKDKLNDR